MKNKAVKRLLFQEKDSEEVKGNEINNEAMKQPLLQQPELDQKRQKSKFDTFTYLKLPFFIGRNILQRTHS